VPPTLPLLDPAPPTLRTVSAPAERGDAVELVAWPAEGDRRAALAVAGRPRLLLVAAGEAPPSCVDPLEDWVRLPGDPVDIESRRSLLRRRWGPPASRPVLDEDGVLRHGRHLAILPPVEARLAACLLRDADSVVAREALLDAGWPHRRAGDASADGRVLDGRIKLLRRRVAPLGLTIHTVRGVGFLLEW
jgi:hypothetical protein